MTPAIARAYVNAYLSDDEREVILVRRGDDGTIRQRRVPAEWVSFHRASQVEAHRRELKSSPHVASVRDEGEWVRVTWRGWKARNAVCVREDGPLAQTGIDSFEADVNPVRRYLTDHAVPVARPRRAYFDIETDSRVPFSDKERARILSWTLSDGAGRVRSALLAADDDAAERELLRELWVELERYDQVLAWYGDGFDFPVVRARTKRLLPEALRHDRRILWLDHLALFRKMNLTSAESGDEKQSMALQAVSESLLGYGKADFDASKTWQAWAAGGEERARLLRYNEQDVELLPAIEAKTGYVELFQTLCEACGVFPESVSIGPTLQVDSFMLRLGRERGHRFATKRYSEEEEQGKYRGAYVMAPSRIGIVRDVHVCDFGGMYPNIVLTWNMSPETKVGSGRGPNTCVAPSTGVVFRTDVEGMLPLALRTLMDLRKSWNAQRTACTPGTDAWKEADRRATAYKVAANSFYGVIGSPFSRYYDREVAESITQQGVWLIQRTLDLARREGMECFYSDTDSAFIVGASREQFAAFVARCNDEHYPRMVAETGAVKNTTSLAYEKQFARLVIIAKKRYCGWVAHYKGKAGTPASRPEVKGLEYKRGDTSLLARRLQIIAIALLRDHDEPGPFEEMAEVAREHVLRGALAVEEVRVAKTLSKSLSEYEVRLKKNEEAAAAQPHVALARRLLQEGKIQSVRRFRTVDGRRAPYEDVPAGVRVEYVVTDAAGDTLKVISAGEYDGANVDRYYLWERLVWRPTERLLEAVFPNHDWKAWGKVRPKRPRARANPDQTAFAFAEVRQAGAIKRA